MADLQQNHTVTYHNINYGVLVKSPSETDTELQVICFFDYSKNSQYHGGTEAVNVHFNNDIDFIRKAGLFKGELGQTLLLNPHQQQIQAHRLLLIGLGDPEKLTCTQFEMVGYIVVQEAIKIGVGSLCFAPSIKDAGVDEFKADEISAAVVSGMDKAILDAQTLHKKSMLASINLKDIWLLAGEAQASRAFDGIKSVFL